MARFEFIGEFENVVDAEYFSKFLMDEVGIESGVAHYSGGNAVWVVGSPEEIDECRRWLDESFRRESNQN